MVIRVLVVDDSAVIRQVLSEIIQSDPAFELIGAVADPIFAMRRMQINRPDVLVLDVEMPRMDGISFLKKIMREDPLPVVICSSLTQAGSGTAHQAMAAGAIAYIAKPSSSVKNALREEGALLLDALKSAAKANMTTFHQIADTMEKPVEVVNTNYSADVVLPPPAAASAMVETTERVVAIGTSTGGTQALEMVLRQMPVGCAGLVIVQHMPAHFTAAFATRLNGLCAITVKEAQDRDRVLPGQALIAPGDYHLVLKRSGAQYYVSVVSGPLVKRHRPSVDVLFRSVAKTAGRNAQGIIMTGMGDDGASGLREMQQAGARTLAQDEASCVVYGMPREAVRLGGVEKSVPLHDIAAEIVQFGTQTAKQ